MSRKPILRPELIEVRYSEDRWRLLAELRRRALGVMEALEARGLCSIVHGSVARGDVRPNSDVDVFVLNAPSSFIIEAALEEAGFKPVSRAIVKATPAHAAKGYIQLDETLCVSFPIDKLSPVERDFYRFGGELDAEGLRRGLRVPGVDKRLMLIEPTEFGHVESSIVGREAEVSKLLGVDVSAVLDRVRALARRDRVGRTGVFLQYELKPWEGFEQALHSLAKRDPALRGRG